MDIWYTKKEAERLRKEDKLREEFNRLYSKIYKDLTNVESNYDKRFISEDISSYIIEDKYINIICMPYTVLKPLFGISRILCDKYGVEDTTIIKYGNDMYKIPSAETSKVIEIIHKADEVISATNYESDLTGRYLTDGTHLDCTRREYISRINTGLKSSTYTLPDKYIDNTVEYVNRLITDYGVKYLPEEIIKVVDTGNSVQVTGNNYKFIYDVWVELVYYHYMVNSQQDSIRCVYDGVESYIPKSTVSAFKNLCKQFNKLISETDYSPELLQYTVAPDFNAIRMRASKDRGNIIDKHNKPKSILSSFFKL